MTDTKHRAASLRQQMSIPNVMAIFRAKIAIFEYGIDDCLLDRQVSSTPTLD